MPREIEGDWIWRWPDRKRPHLLEGKDSRGRVIFGRTPLLDLEGLITPVDSYYVVARPQMPEPIHPDDWVLSIGGEVARPVELTLEELRKLPGRTIRAVTECAGNDTEFFNYLRDGGKKPSLASKQDLQKLAELRQSGKKPSLEDIGEAVPSTGLVSAGEFTGVPLAEVLKKAGLKSTAVSVRAQTREQLLNAAECFAASEVAAHRAQVNAVRAATADVKEEQRLLARVPHLRELVAWGEQWQWRLRQAAARHQPLVSEEQEAAFADALEVAHKVLNDREPGAKDKLLSLADRDVRTGKHSDSYEGYLLDVSLDADSELICAVEVLPANGDEAANAKHLIASEEHAHGNDIASLSVDRIGYRGDVLSALSEEADRLVVVQFESDRAGLVEFFSQTAPLSSSGPAETVRERWVRYRRALSTSAGLLRTGRFRGRSPVGEPPACPSHVLFSLR